MPLASVQRLVIAAALIVVVIVVIIVVLAALGAVVVVVGEAMLIPCLSPSSSASAAAEVCKRKKDKGKEKKKRVTGSLVSQLVSHTHHSFLPSFLPSFLHLCIYAFLHNRTCPLIELAVWSRPCPRPVWTALSLDFHYRLCYPYRMRTLLSRLSVSEWHRRDSISSRRGREFATCLKVE